MTEFKCGTWFLGISEVLKVVEMVMGIWNRPEIFQEWFAGVMGPNSIPPFRISPQDPEEDARSL